MNRIFLAMAITNGTLLAVVFAIGFAAGAEPRGPGEFWRGLHWLLGVFATMLGLLVHSIAYTYFLGTGKWVDEVARVYRLPDWLGEQARRNKRRAFPFALVGMIAVSAAAWLGAGADAQGWPSSWHLGAASLALAFNLGAFVVEYAAIVGQARLLIEVKDQADRLRLAQVGDGGGPAPV